MSSPVAHATLTSASMLTPSNGEANATPSASSGKVRAACNRCHAQKLRCVKRENQMKCERCNRLNTSCRFSPRAPRSSLKQREPAVDGVQGVPALSQTTDTSNVHLDSILGDYQNEWMAPEDLTTDLTNTSDPNMYFDLCDQNQSEFSDIFDLPWPNASPASHTKPQDQYGLPNLDLIPIDSSIANRMSPSYPASPGSRSGGGTLGNDDNHASSPVRDLGHLSVALYECARNLPSMPEVGVYPPGLPYISPGEKQSTRKVAFFAIDELFQLTSKFVDTLKQLSHSELEANDILLSTTPRSVPETVQPLLTYSPFSQSAPKTHALPGSGPFSHVDEATMLLVMSCHCRLVDTYISVLRMMQACIEHAITPRMEEDAVILLPKLQIGSHESPAVEVNAKKGLPPSASGMYMFMIIMVSTKLCEQMVELIGTGWDKEGDDEEMEGNTFLQSRRAMWDSMKGKTDGLAQDIEDMRVLLQRKSATAR